MFLNLFAATAQIFLGAFVFGVVNDAGAQQGSTFTWQTHETHFRRHNAP